VIDERLARALHVQALRHAELAPEHEPHVLFQASTIGALLEAAYDGDVTFAELAGHGDLGLGTLNALDGEMIALDGRFLRADVDGGVTEIDPAALTPFAVVVDFTPTIELSLDLPLDHAGLLTELDRVLPDGTAACAVRVDGEFELVRARSVPRQHQPYRPLPEVVAEQHVFELHDVSGTLVGFRFPEYSGTVEISGYHLHFGLRRPRARGPRARLPHPLRDGSARPLDRPARRAATRRGALASQPRCRDRGGRAASRARGLRTRRSRP